MYDEYEAQFLHKAWQILQDISEQLAHNNQFAGSLRQRAEQLKGSATQFAQGFPLRRYNVDLTKGTPALLFANLSSLSDTGYSTRNVRI